MNRDEIIRMAREAGLQPYYQYEFMQFAALVAAAEREACAKVCESLWEIDGRDTADEFANAIRARGNP